jgi:hypothetical protein
MEILLPLLPMWNELQEAVPSDASDVVDVLPGPFSCGGRTAMSETLEFCEPLQGKFVLLGSSPSRSHALPSEKGNVGDRVATSRSRAAGKSSLPFWMDNGLGDPEGGGTTDVRAHEGDGTIDDVTGIMLLECDCCIPCCTSMCEVESPATLIDDDKESAPDEVLL